MSTSATTSSYAPTKITSPAPPPLPPCDAPTPQSAKAMLEEQARQAKQAKEEEFTKAMEETKQKTGLLSTFKVYAKTVSHATEKAVSSGYGFVEKKVEENISELDLKRFREAFPDLQEEELLGDFVCQVLNRSEPVKGNLQITRASLCFTSSGLKFVQKLSQIVSVQLAVQLPVRKGASPRLVILPAPEVLPSALQIYTIDGEVHQFFGFGGALQSSVQCLQDAYNVLDHAWRDATPVPNPDYIYAKAV